MSKLIDADAMVEEYITKGSIYDTSDLKEMLDYMPAVDAVPVVHGKWVHVEGDESWEWRCTVCHKIAEGFGEFKFCPNCGAKMDGKEQNDEE